MRAILLLITGFFCLNGIGQTINDVLRYSLENTQGTARFQAMGGAFGALGGDLSSLNVNPAGSAVFNYGQAAFTGSVFVMNNTSVANAGLGGQSQSEFNVNQAGGVFVFEAPNSAWKKIAVGLNYDLVNNFDSETRTSTSGNPGLDQYFLSYAQGVPFGDILLREGESVADAYLAIGEFQGFGDQQAFLGYFGGLIDPANPDDENNTLYNTNASYTNLNQDFYESVNGFNSKFTMNVAGQYMDNLYVGMALNFHTVFLTRLTQLRESGFDSDSEIQSSTFDNYLETNGDGFSFSIGAIAKLNEAVRVGASYQSPTWYRLEDNLSQRVNSTLADTEINQVSFNLVNLFPVYTVQTPGKLTASAAIVFGKDGLLSFDYGYQDFSNAMLRPNDGTFDLQNQEIANVLGAANTYRLGGEYRIERVSLRAGYRFEQSPYASGNVIGDLTAFSGGLGYDFGGSRLDLSYAHSSRDVNTFFFDSNVDSGALVTQELGTFALTYTLKF